MKLTAHLKSIFLALCLLFCSCLAFSQGIPGDPGPDPDPDPIPSAEIPIDLGLGLFIAAGIGYATKRKMDSKKGQPANKQ